MRRAQYKSALSQIKAAAREAEEAGEEWSGPSLNKRKIEFIDSLEVKNSGVERRRTAKNEKANLHRKAREARQERIQDENITNQWFFNAGDLVIVKGKTNQTSSIYSSKPDPGTIGMIVDTVDHTDWNGTETTGGTIVVMVNGTIEQWNAKWVKHCE